MTILEAFRALPDDEGKLHKELSAGSHATRLLEDDAFKTAVQRLRDGIYGEFAGSDPTSEGDEVRRLARIKLSLINQILSDLRKTEDTGKMAETQLGFLEKMKRKLKAKV